MVLKKRSRKKKLKTIIKFMKSEKRVPFDYIDEEVGLFNPDVESEMMKQIEGDGPRKRKKPRLGKLLRKINPIAYKLPKSGHMKRILKRMTKTIPSDKEYKTLVKEPSGGNKAPANAVSKAEDILQKEKELMKPSGYRIKDEVKTEAVYNETQEEYKASSDKKQDLPKEQKVPPYERGVKHLMTKYLEKMYALPSKGPFRQLDATTQRLKEIFLKKYK